MKHLLPFLLAFLLISLPQPARAVPVATEELAEARRWSAAKFEGIQTPRGTELPFSFVFGGKPSAELLRAWKHERSSHRLDAQRQETTLTWTDASTGLRVRCVGVEYADFPTVRQPWW